MITQINFEYRIGMLKGTEEFKKSLKTTYNVHEHPKWLPAAEGNFEIWFDLFFDTSLIDFLQSAIIGGIVYDITKDKVFRPFVNALNTLKKTNEYPLEIRKYKFYFEDTKVVIYGLTDNFTSIFSAIFTELHETYHLISELIKPSPIYEIRIPVDRDSKINEWWVGPEEIEPYLTYWGISIDYGVTDFLWDVKNKRQLP